jgi:adenylate cyclase
MRIQQRLAVACKMCIKEQITKNVLSAYLGPDAGEQVLKGQIKLGDGETTHAVIWFSDLRNSSGLADTLQPEEFITLINEYFKGMAGAVLDSGGQVLRFIGDAVLAIFPIRDGHENDGMACATALVAARDAVDRMTVLNKTRKADNKEALGFGIGLHVGDVMYGNIGVPERV